MWNTALYSTVCLKLQTLMVRCEDSVRKYRIYCDEVWLTLRLFWFILLFCGTCITQVLCNLLCLIHNSKQHWCHFVLSLNVAPWRAAILWQSSGQQRSTISIIHDTIDFNTTAVYVSASVWILSALCDNPIQSKMLEVTIQVAQS